MNKKLTPEQKHILNDEGTEPPGSSPLNYEKRQGSYHCVRCGTKLFESKTKYDTTIVYAKKYNIIVVVYNNTTATFDINSFVRDIGLVRYILKVPFEYSPDIISDGTIVDKNGI